MLLLKEKVNYMKHKNISKLDKYKIIQSQRQINIDNVSIYKHIKEALNLNNNIFNYDIFYKCISKYLVSNQTLISIKFCYKNNIISSIHYDFFNTIDYTRFKYMVHCFMCCNIYTHQNMFNHLTSKNHIKNYNTIIEELNCFLDLLHYYNLKHDRDVFHKNETVAFKPNSNTNKKLRKKN